MVTQAEYDRLLKQKLSNLETMATARVLDFSMPHVPRNSKEYRMAVAEIDRLLDLDPKKGTTAYDRLEFLRVLVEAYENEAPPFIGRAVRRAHWPLRSYRRDAHDAIQARGGTPPRR